MAARCPRCKSLCTEGELKREVIIYSKTILVNREDDIYEPFFVRKEIRRSVCSACEVEEGGRNVYTRW